MVIILYVSVSLALWWDSGVSDPISAVVIYSVFASNPSESTVLEGIEVLKFLLIPPAFTLTVTESGIHRGFTAIDMETLVCSNKWSLRPIGFLETSTGRPVVSVP